MELPVDFTKRMKEMLGTEFDPFAAAFCSGEPERALRVNTYKRGALDALCSVVPLRDRVEWCPDGYYIGSDSISGRHPYHAAGLFYFQEPSAMAAVEALPIECGDRILDLCAAPGGKATQAAAKLDGSGMLVANEITPKRAQILSENIERLGFSNVIVTNETPQKLSERFTAFFDKIIVDAPCSGEGMFRKEPRALTEWSVEHTHSCALRQRNILDSAVHMLRGGGYLLYSTCTFAPEEDEGIAEYLLDTYPFLKLCEIPALDMLCGGIPYPGGTHDLSAVKRIFPHKNRGEGHFIALFRRTDDNAPRCTQARSSSTAASPQAEALYTEWAKSSLRRVPEGVLYAFGDKLYLMPEAVNTDKLRVLRAGLELGVCKKGRFEPAHALCTALCAEDFLNTADYRADSAELLKYLHGEVLPHDQNGWCAVTADGYPIGWGKASGGTLKNRYPKALRSLY